MNRKRGRDVSIDLRRTDRRSSRLGHVSGRLYAAALTLTTLLTGGLLVLQLLNTALPREIPFRISESRTYWTTEERGIARYRVGGGSPYSDVIRLSWDIRRAMVAAFSGGNPYGEPASTSWEVTRPAERSQGLQEGDQILAINGIEPSAEDQERLVESLRGAKRATIAVMGVLRQYQRSRVPAMLVNLAPGEKVPLSAEDRLGNVAAVVWTSSDSTVATIDSEGRLSARAPGQAVVRAVDPSFGVIASVAVNVGRQGLGLPIAVGAPTTLEIDPVKPAAIDRLGGLSFTIIGLFGLLVGLVALRARSDDPAIQRFIVLCLLLGSLPAVGLPGEWKMWTSPFVVKMPFESWSNWNAALKFPVLALLLCAFLRFLHVFPQYDATLVERYPVPRSVLAIGVIGPFLVFQPAWSLETVTISEPGVAAVGLAVVLFAVFILAVVGWSVSVFILALRILRLSRERMQRVSGPEEVQQGKLVLSAVRAGFNLFRIVATILVILAIGSVFTIYPHMLISPLTAVGAVALLVPFVGVSLAIVRKGLWSVDLIIKRATVYSILTGLFIIAFLVLEVTVENLLPTSLFGIGWIDDLSVAAVATGLVAVSHRWVTRALTRRLFPEAVNFDRAIEQISEQIASGSGASPAEDLGKRLTAVLGANPCAVLVRLQKNLFRNVWSAGEIASTALVAGAASPALEQHPSAIVMTDEGPILAARIGTGESYGGLLLLGPRPGGGFYTTEERRLLRPLLNQAALLLKSSG